jgi:uncharacterized protein (TIGR02246 family)
MGESLMNETALARIVRDYYAAYEAADRTAIVPLLAEDFRFSSPLDDRIDLATYLAKCWPFSSERPHFEIETLLESDGVVSATYRCTSSSRPSFRNTELFRFRDGEVVEIAVYFGRDGVAMENADRPLRRLIEDRSEAVRTKDAQRAAEHVAEDAILFDVVDPLRRIGKAAFLTRAQEWFDTFAGEIGFEIGELTITAGDDTAFHSGLNHLDAKTKEGVRFEMWWRSSVGYRKIDGRWWIVHEHNSVPFDPATGRASLALRP